MLPFSEERLADSRIVYGTAGGPMFNTQIVATHSGGEERNVNWQTAKGEWEFGQRDLLSEDWARVLKFFRARKGQAQGFRFKDWSDYTAATSEGLLVPVAGSPGQWQLYKQYVSGLDTDMRKIQKPVPGMVKVFEAGVQVVAAIDYTTGIVSYSKADPTAALTWSGEFDVPVRFGVDTIKPTFMGMDVRTKQAIFALPSTPLVEIRV